MDLFTLSMILLGVLFACLALGLWVGFTLVAVGLVAGLAAYYFRVRDAGSAGEELAGPVHMIVGIKFVLLACIGACLGIGSAKAKRGQFAAAHGLRWVSLLLLAGAALLGVFV